MPTLAELESGTRATIYKVKKDKGTLYKHILDMGLTPGTEIVFIKTAPMGDPMEILVRGYKLALRKSDASNIEVINVKKESKFLKNEKNQFTKKSQFEDLPRKNLSQDNDIILKNDKKIKLALIGNQNSGKTTLFNQLTGANQHVGNFPGVTIDKTDGIIRGHNNVIITDLPGVYSLSPYSNEEIITRDFLLNERPDAIINVIDGSNIERNLFLSLQLLEIGIPIVIAINMMDEVCKNGGTIDIKILEEKLGVPIVPISALKNKGIEELIQKIIFVAKNEKIKNEINSYYGENNENGKNVFNYIEAVIELIKENANKIKIPIYFAAIKLIEGDNLILQKLKLSDDKIKILQNIITKMEIENSSDKESIIASIRFSFIEKICLQSIQKPTQTKTQKNSDKIDKILTGKFTAIPVFILIMFSIFFISFGSIGAVLSNLTENIINNFSNYVENWMIFQKINPILISLIVNGIIAGVGGILSFLPIIIILFFFLSILEDSGYMARVAFFMDKSLRSIGLSGRSFVPMLIGFGCSVPAIMSCRTLPSERDRKMTIFLIPFMSCSAKLPIYALLTATFFHNNQGFVIISLYLIGIIVGLIAAFLLKKFFFKGELIPFIIELPNYRMPSVKNVARLIYYKSKYFITKAFTIIFFASLLIWFLQTFDAGLNIVSDSSGSLLNKIGNLIVPIFKPLGIYDWRLSTAFLTGLMAKESIVSTLSVSLNGHINLLPTLLTPLSAFSFLVFSLLYTPCIATIAAVRKELGIKYALLIIVAQCLIAWLIAFSIYNISCKFL